MNAENLDRSKNADERIKELTADVKSARWWKKFWGGVVVFMVVAMLLLCGWSVWYIANLGTEFRQTVANVSSPVQNAVVQNAVPIQNAVTNELSKAARAVKAPDKDTQNPTIAKFDIKRNNLLSADYLAVAVPFLLALGGVLFALLGLGRLKMIDDRIDKIRTDSMREIESRVDSAAKAAESDFILKHREEIDAQQKKIEAAIDKVNTMSVDGVQKVKEQCAQRVESFCTLVTDVEAKYGWLTNMGTEKQIGDFDIATVADAHNAVEKLRNDKPRGYTAIIKKIIEKVCDGDSIISGDGDDYHNLAAEIANGSMYDEACRVIEQGLTLFENNSDLLADLVNYATSASRFEVAKEAIEKLLTLDKRQWTWRCYSFIADHYKKAGNLDEAVNICQEGMAALPNREEFYRIKAELEQLLHPGEKGIDTAISTLEEALKQGFPAAQCALVLSQLYRNKGEHQKAIDAATRSIADSAADQPSVPIAAVIANRGFAFDKLYWEKKSSGESGMDELGKSAIADYSTALDLAEETVLTLITDRQVRSRLAILKQEGFDVPDLKAVDCNGGVA